MLSLSTATKDISWSSSDDTIVSVDEVGGVRAMGREGTATVTATSGENAAVTASCTITVSGESQEVNIKDPAFKQLVIKTLKNRSDNLKKLPLSDLRQYEDYTTESMLYTEDVEKIARLSSSGTMTHVSGIADMSGIEYFKNLEYLYIAYQYITALDVSMLENLTRFDCHGNNIKITGQRGHNCDFIG